MAMQVAAGFAHTVLLKSDGTAVACGRNDHGQCNIPALKEGVSYTNVAVVHTSTAHHTVLLKSDGSAVACGCNLYGQCDIPELPKGIRYVGRDKQIMVTLSFGNSHVALCLLSGRELYRIEVDPTWRFLDVQHAIIAMIGTDYGKFCIIMPSGEPFNTLCKQSPSCSIEPFLARQRLKSKE